MPTPGFLLSHFGLFVSDILAMETFYVHNFDFTVTDRGELPSHNGVKKLVFLSRDPDAHHQLVLVTGRPRDTSFNPINQISLKADSLSTLCTMFRTLSERGTRDMQSITHGNAVSIYTPDPEGNRLELYYDLPWYVSQPMAMPVDLNNEEDLMATLESHARTLPGFRPRAEWRAEMAALMKRF